MPGPQERPTSASLTTVCLVAPRPFDLIFPDLQMKLSSYPSVAVLRSALFLLLVVFLLPALGSVTLQLINASLIPTLEGDWLVSPDLFCAV